MTEIIEGTIVEVVSSGSGYVGKGVIVGLMYGNTYLIQTKDDNRPMITANAQNLKILSIGVQKEEDEQPKRKSKKDKEREELPAEAWEGRHDSENPTDGNKSKGKGNGKRLAKRSRRGRTGISTGRR